MRNSCLPFTLTILLVAALGGSDFQVAYAKGFDLQAFPDRSEEDRPKFVIFIFTDDLGYGDLSCYNSSSQIHTPHIDQLAQDGLRFTDAHTSSAVCTPSRYSLLTGRYCWRTALKEGVFGGYNLPLIDAERATLGNLFQEQGYRTAAIGKWHLGMKWTLKTEETEQEEETVDHVAPLLYTPIDQGFDYFFGTAGCPSDDGPFSFIENRQVVGPPVQRIEELNVVGDADFFKDVWATPRWQHERVDTLFTNKALEFLEASVTADTSCFIYLALSLPHIPWLPAGFVKGTTNAGPRGDLVALADYCVKEIDHKLATLGIKEETLLVFSSDNGPRKGVNGHRSAGHLRGYK